MKALLLFLAICQLAVAVNIAPVVIGGNGISKLCPSEEELERAIQSIRNSTRDLTRISQTKPQCGEGIWYQLVAINTSTADSQCPDGWVEENEGGVRACGRGSVAASCQSIYLNNIRQIDYTRVCGRAIGYQYGHPDAFARRDSDVTADQNYADGLSITHGFPRQHIWTYAAAVRDGDVPFDSIYHCPCSINPGASPPCFVGNNWYCESGNPNMNSPTSVLSNDLLWDGVDCEGTCCSNGKSPPWFSVQLPAPTNDYIEARICANEHSDDEDVFINVFEIYIQ
jgi:hypothetical protein